MRFGGALYIALLIVIVIVLFYAWEGMACRRSNMSSGNEFPGQLVATAAMQEEIAGGYNQPERLGDADPYYGAMIDFSSQENAWNTSDWSGTQ